MSQSNGAEECHVEPDGETSAEEASAEFRIAELEAEIVELKSRELDYQLLLDVPNNRIIIQRATGPLVVQEIWGPEFAKDFADSLAAQVRQLANDRRQFEAQLRATAREAERQPQGQGARPSALWTPNEPRLDARGPAAAAAARAAGAPRS